MRGARGVRGVSAAGGPGRATGVSSAGGPGYGRGTRLLGFSCCDVLTGETVWKHFALILGFSCCDVLTRVFPVATC